MGSLLPKLGQLLMEGYNLQKNAKKGVESLLREMKSMHAALCKVAEVPRHQLDEQVKLWADNVRDLSYDIENVIDKFIVRVESPNKPAADGNKLTDLVEKMANLFTKGKARRQIASAIKDINKEVQEVANRRGRYTVDNIVPKPTAGTTIDPRLRALYTEVTELVGIYGKRDQELLKLLSLGDEDPSNKRPKIVSVVGFGGLGKTTLVRAVYDKIKGGFNSRAFVPVGQNPDMKKILRDILIGLDKNTYTNINLMVLDERQLIEEIREFLHDKRYLVVIDDIWDGKLCRDINLAFSNMNNLGSRLITTTRIFSVSVACCPSTHDSIYQMEPLSDSDSTRLFCKRIFSSENEYLFLRIVAAVEKADDNFKLRKDCCGQLSFSPLQKCTAALRMLAYGKAADAIDTEIRKGESTVLATTVQFARTMVKVFGGEYLRDPTMEDTKKLLAIGAARGFPGMLSSVDCMHWQWKNCPKDLRGQYQGHFKEATIILEAVASKDLWIWHASFGTPGSCNDSNVLQRSPLFKRLCDGEAPPCNYTVNRRNYTMAYSLADGIYPQWMAFVKTISDPQGNKQSRFATMQEVARKDVERAFGVLQARWAIVRGAAMMWEVETIWQLMTCCVILHNIIVEDEGEGAARTHDFEKARTHVCLPE